MEKRGRSMPVRGKKIGEEKRLAGGRGPAGCAGMRTFRRQSEPICGAAACHADIDRTGMQHATRTLAPRSMATRNASGKPRRPAASTLLPTSAPPPTPLNAAMLESKDDVLFMVPGFDDTGAAGASPDAEPRLRPARCQNGRAQGSREIHSADI